MFLKRTEKSLWTKKLFLPVRDLPVGFTSRTAVYTSVRTPIKLQGGNKEYGPLEVWDAMRMTIPGESTTAAKADKGN